MAGLNAAMPSGGIIIWSKPIADIPSGWYLCDGANGTPNLGGKFIQGAGSGYAVGSSGGEASHILTTNEMPVHTHAQDPHGHSASMSPATVHTEADAFWGARYGSPEVMYNYNHSVSITVYQTTATNQNAGGGDAHNNLPPFFTLAFIMKS